MGTNYYVRVAACDNACEHCTESKLVHLGKSSVGWKFLFAAKPGWPRAEALNRWLDLARSGPIENEYGVASTLDELLVFIMMKQTAKYCGCVNNGLVVSGPFWDDFKDHRFHCGGFDFTDREFS